MPIAFYENDDEQRRLEEQRRALESQAFTDRREWDEKEAQQEAFDTTAKVVGGVADFVTQGLPWSVVSAAAKAVATPKNAARFGRTVAGLGQREDAPVVSDDPAWQKAMAGGLAPNVPPKPAGHDDHIEWDQATLDKFGGVPEYQAYEKPGMVASAKKRFGLSQAKAWSGAGQFALSQAEGALGAFMDAGEKGQMKQKLLPAIESLHKYAQGFESAKKDLAPYSKETQEAKGAGRFANPQYVFEHGMDVASELGAAITTTAINPYLGASYIFGRVAGETTTDSYERLKDNDNFTDEEKRRLSSVEGGIAGIASVVLEGLSNLNILGGKTAGSMLGKITGAIPAKITDLGYKASVAGSRLGMSGLSAKTGKAVGAGFIEAGTELLEDLTLAAGIWGLEGDKDAFKDFFARAPDTIFFSFLMGGAAKAGLSVGDMPNTKQRSYEQAQEGLAEVRTMVESKAGRKKILDLLKTGHTTRSAFEAAGITTRMGGPAREALQYFMRPSLSSLQQTEPGEIDVQARKEYPGDGSRARRFSTDPAKAGYYAGSRTERLSKRMKQQGEEGVAAEQAARAPDVEALPPASEAPTTDFGRQLQEAIGPARDARNQASAEAKRTEIKDRVTKLQKQRDHFRQAAEDATRKNNPTAADVYTRQADDAGKMINGQLTMLQKAESKTIAPQPQPTPQQALGEPTVPSVEGSPTMEKFAKHKEDAARKLIDATAAEKRGAAKTAEKLRRGAEWSKKQAETARQRYEAEHGKVKEEKPAAKVEEPTPEAQAEEVIDSKIAPGRRVDDTGIDPHHRTPYDPPSFLGSLGSAMGALNRKLPPHVSSKVQGFVKTIREYGRTVKHLDKGAGIIEDLRTGRDRMLHEQTRQAVHDVTFTLEKTAGWSKTRAERVYGDARDFLAGTTEIGVLPKRTRVPLTKLREHLDHLTRKAAVSGAVAGAWGVDGKDRARVYDTIKAHYRKHGDSPEFIAEQFQAHGVGKVDADILATLVRNESSYLTRTYEAFTTSDWANRVPPKAWADIVTMLEEWEQKRVARIDKVNQHRAELGKEPLEYTQRTIVDHTREAKRILHDAKGSKDLETMMGGKNGRQYRDILRHRVDLPEAYRAFLGQEKHPITNAINTAHKLGEMIHTYQFQQEMAEYGSGKFMWRYEDKNRPDDAHRLLATATDKDLMPYDGLYVTPEFEAVLKPDLSKQSNAFMRGLRWFDTKTQRAKTSWSSVAHMRQVLGNPFTTLANGNIPFTGKRPGTWAVSLLGGGEKAARQFYNEGAKRLLVGEGVQYGAMNRFANRDPTLETVREMTKGRGIAHKATRTLMNVPEKIRTQYGYEDTVTKLDNWAQEMKKYEKAEQFQKDADGNLTPQGTKDLMDHTARIVRITTPSYADLPRFIGFIQEFPMFGQFMAFPMSQYSNAYTRAQLSIKEAFSNDPVIRSIGRRRIIAQIATYSAPKIAERGSAYLSGISDEERRAFHRQQAPWNRYMPTIFLGHDKGGAINYLVAGYIDPHSAFLVPLRMLMAGFTEDEVQRGLGEATGSFLGAFIQETMSLTAALELLTGVNENGTPVVADYDDNWTKARVHAERFLTTTVLPGIIASGLDVQKGWEGRVSKGGQEYSLGTTLTTMMTGIKLQKTNPKQAFGFRMSKYTEGLDDSRKKIQGILRNEGYNSEEEKRADLERSNTIRANATKEAHQVYLDTNLLYPDVVNADKARVMLERSRMKSDDIDALITGIPSPWMPTDIGDLDQLIALTSGETQVDMIKQRNEKLDGMLSTLGTKRDLSAEHILASVETLTSHGFDARSAVKTQAMTYQKSRFEAKLKELREEYGAAHDDESIIRAAKGKLAEAGDYYTGEQMRTLDTIASRMKMSTEDRKYMQKQFQILTDHRDAKTLFPKSKKPIELMNEEELGVFKADLKKRFTDAVYSVGHPTEPISGPRLHELTTTMKDLGITKEYAMGLVVDKYNADSINSREARLKNDFPKLPTPLLRQMAEEVHKQQGLKWTKSREARMRVLGERLGFSGEDVDQLIQGYKDSKGRPITPPPVVKGIQATQPRAAVTPQGKTQLSPQDEGRFQSWYAEWSEKADLAPNPDDPQHYYDYRGAWKSGETPKMDPEDGRYHFSSQFKLKGHPRMVLDGVNTKTGQPVRPKLGVSSVRQARPALAKASVTTVVKELSNQELSGSAIAALFRSATRTDKGGRVSGAKEMMTREMEEGGLPADTAAAIERLMQPSGRRAGFSAQDLPDQKVHTTGGKMISVKSAPINKALIEAQSSSDGRVTDPDAMAEGDKRRLTKGELGLLNDLLTAKATKKASDLTMEEIIRGFLANLGPEALPLMKEIEANEKKAKDKKKKTKSIFDMMFKDLRKKGK